MLTYEIENFITHRDFHLNHSQLSHIQNTSPQVTEIVLSQKSDNTEIWAIRTMENRNFEVILID